MLSKEDEQLLIIAIILVIIVCIVYYIYAKSPKYNIVEEHYRRVHGNLHDDNVDIIIREAKQNDNLRPIDNYRAAVVNIQNAGDIKEGERLIIRTLNDIMIDNDQPNMIDQIRINDNITAWLGIIDIENEFGNQFNHENADFIRQLMLAIEDNIHVNIRRPQLAQESKTTKPIKRDEHFIEKSIVANQHWVSDSQNVHDAKMTEIMIKQYNLVLREVTDECINIPYETAKGIVWKQFETNYAKGGIYFSTQSNYDEKHKKLSATFDTIERNSEITYVDEISIFRTVVNRAYSRGNEENKDKILLALVDSMIQQTEPIHSSTFTVCITGRSKMMWQSLALLDRDPDIGIMKSRQMILNEIYEKIGYLTNIEEEKLSETAKLAYINNIPNQEVDTMKLAILSHIDHIASEYTDEADKKTIDIAIETCKNALV